ncbi:MAG: hypothetical protein ABW321_23825 [Polyangiales bacterium]
MHVLRDRETSGVPDGAARRALHPATQVPHWIVVAATLFCALRRMAGNGWVPVFDPDVWWVAAAGRVALETGRAPAWNLFSFTEPERPWIMHEWLLGPLYALGLTRMGPAFFVLVALGAYGLGLHLIVRATLGRARHSLVGVLFAGVGTVFFLRRLVSARPMHLAALCPLGLGILAFGPAFSRWQLLGVVVIEWLWANCHGSFPLGLLLLMAAALDAERDRRRRWIALGLAGAVSFVNPYGAKLHVFVWHYFAGGAGIFRSIHQHSSEFGSLFAAWGKLIKLQELVGCTLGVCLALVVLATPRHRVRGLVCLGLWVMAFRQARHIDLAGLLSCVLLLPWADARLRAWSRPPQLEAAFRRRASWLLVGPVWLLAALIFTTSYTSRHPGDWVDPDFGFAGELAAVPDGARLFIPFHYAGYAIWHGYPRGIRVFFDPRNDCYTSEALERYVTLNAARDPSEARQLLDASHTDTVLAPTGHPLLAILADTPGWQPLAGNPAHGYRRHQLQTR